MQENVLEDFIVKALPLRYACQKVILNRRGKAEDSVFLNINHEFEEMSGIKRELILGQRVSSLFPKICGDRIDWVSFFGNVAMTGEKSPAIKSQ